MPDRKERQILLRSAATPRHIYSRPAKMPPFKSIYAVHETPWKWRPQGPSKRAQAGAQSADTNTTLEHRTTLQKTSHALAPSTVAHPPSLGTRDYTATRDR